MNALKYLALAFVAMVAATPLAAQNTPPTISVTSGATPIADGTVVNVNLNDTVAAFNLTITVDDADSDPVFLDVSVSNVTTQGLDIQEWTANSGTPFNLTPTSGVFNVPDVEHTIVLTAFDGTDLATFTLIVLVAADVGNSTPKIVLQAGGSYVANDTFFTAPFNWTVAQLGLTARALDADGDNLDVDVFVSNVTTQGLEVSEWTAVGAPAGSTLAPTSGQFNVPDVKHTIILTVSDGTDTTSLRVFVVVSAESGNSKPKLALFSNGAYIAEGAAVPIPYNTLVADLGLEARVLDANNAFLDVDVSVSNFTTQGLEVSEWTGTNIMIGSFLTPTSGQFNVGDVAHVLSVTVSDGTDSVIYNYILLIGPDGVSSTNAAPFIGVFAGQQYIDNGLTVPLPFNTQVADLNLRVVVADYEGDATAASLVGVSNFTTQGLVPAEWESGASAVPYELNPTSGQFNVGSVDHVVDLSADDSNSVFNYSFTIEVGAGPTPPPPSSGGDKKKDDDGCTARNGGPSWTLLALAASMLALGVRRRIRA
jgi:hypothetical protein